MSLDTKKATGVDKIPPKLVKLAADVLATPLSLAINSSIDKGAFPDAAKVASVSSADKKLTMKIKYPILYPSAFKVYEIIIKNHLVSIMNKHFSPYIAAYRQNYSCQHVLLQAFAKAFDCIPHDLLIAKLLAYKIDDKIVQIFFSYLQNRKQCVKISSEFLNIISEVPQGSIAGPILFNAFINDFSFLLKRHLYKILQMITLFPVLQKLFLI